MRTKIEWCDYTWNPWWGCARVSPGCQNCYAEKMGKRFGVEWGAGAERRLSSDRVWSDPFRWAKNPLIHSCGKSFAAPTLHAPDYAQGMVGAGECCGPYRPARVFALSMGDWLEDKPKTWTHGGLPQGGIPAAWLARMLDTIRQTPELHYILVTKRPENWADMIDAIFHSESFDPHDPNAFIQWIGEWAGGNPPQNVCVMVSVEDQERADERIRHLLGIPARWHGISAEPLLGPVDLERIPLVDGYGYGWANPMQGAHKDLTADKRRGPWLDWIVTGGESGQKARPCNVEWIRSLVRQGKEAGCAAFVKQLGSNAKGTAGADYTTLDRKGGAPSEWPIDLRVRQWPEGL